MTLKNVNAAPEFEAPRVDGGALRSPNLPISARMIKKIARNTSQANFSNVYTAFKPKNENIKLIILTITTPSWEPTLPSENAESACPPVIDPEAHHPISWITLNIAMTLDGYQPREYRQIET